MEAIILAGALNSGLLRRMDPIRYEAAITIAGRPMLDYVVEALAATPEIDRLIVVGFPETLSAKLQPLVAVFTEPGMSSMGSMRQGFRELQSKEPVLVVTADLPLLTPAAVSDFLARCRQRESDVYYVYVARETNERHYPGMRRTYVRLREGTVTGGNIGLVVPELVGSRVDLLEKAAELRKNPLKMAQEIGWGFLFQYLRGRMTIPTIEEAVTRICGFRLVGIESPYPEVAIDVDKPSDLELVRAVLEGSNNN
jgi:GTP:adenosylcobinamide-phosphate guanylyltransferase